MGADFDGDEMTLLGISDYESEFECAAFNWDHYKYSPYEPKDFNYRVSKESQVVYN
jgi:hypothetical protein